MADIPPLVTPEMNDMLQKEYTRVEVDTTLHQMEVLKARGLDGMRPMFFQHYWQTIMDDVLAAMLSCLNTGSIPPSINKTFITLIPKVKSPTLVSEYRPISLCNILYKLVSKVIANKSKKILTNLILDSQSAFQLDKAISDNILVAFETLHHMKIQKAKSSEFMALKLDMSKVYERVEWSFLKTIMEKMGFGASWVQLVMECISMVSYLILVNGEPKGEIKPSRGIRQGDPLSPYLFLLYFEGLNRLIQGAIREDKIKGSSLCRNGPRISHLFFADDTLIFCRAVMGDFLALQDILDLYEKASSQQINRRKTTIFIAKLFQWKGKWNYQTF